MHGHIISKQIKTKLVDTNHIYYLSSFLALSQKGKFKPIIMIWRYMF